MRVYYPQNSGTRHSGLIRAKDEITKAPATAEAKQEAETAGDDPVHGVCQAGETWDLATAAERKRCAKIIREALDTGEYERSLGQSIVKRVLKK